jgi:hypothetical protein
VRLGGMLCFQFLIGRPQTLKIFLIHCQYVKHYTKFLFDFFDKYLEPKSHKGKIFLRNDSVLDCLASSLLMAIK